MSWDVLFFFGLKDKLSTHPGRKIQSATDVGLRWLQIDSYSQIDFYIEIWENLISYR